MPSDTAKKANKFVSKDGMKYLLYVIASALLALNIVFTFTINSEDESLGIFNFIILLYIAFFVCILILTKIVPVPIMKDTFAFMKHKFGPGLFIIFICKFKISD